MTVVVLVLAGGLGALVRAEVVAREGMRRGTALVNLGGAALVGLLVGAVGGPGPGGGTFAVLGTGLLGGLTTTGVWFLDTTERPEGDRAVALVVTTLAGMALAAVGWVVGALVS